MLASYLSIPQACQARSRLHNGTGLFFSLECFATCLCMASPMSFRVQCKFYLLSLVTSSSLSLSSLSSLNSLPNTSSSDIFLINWCIDYLFLIPPQCKFQEGRELSSLFFFFYSQCLTYSRYIVNMCTAKVWMNEWKRSPLYLLHSPDSLWSNEWSTNGNLGTSLVVQWLRLCTPNAEFNPWSGIYIPRAATKMEEPTGHH